MKIAKTFFTFFFAFLLLLFLGCTGKSIVYESIYEGLQTRERLKNLDESIPEEEEPLNYQQYKIEREKLLEKNSE